jgi:hypothetical protein
MEPAGAKGTSVVRLDDPAECQAQHGSKPDSGSDAHTRSFQEHRDSAPDSGGAADRPARPARAPREML